MTRVLGVVAVSLLAACSSSSPAPGPDASSSSSSGGSSSGSSSGAGSSSSSSSSGGGSSSGSSSSSGGSSSSGAGSSSSSGGTASDAGPDATTRPGNDGGVKDAGEGGAAAVLAPIPGQDPTAVTTSGPPITALSATTPGVYASSNGGNLLINAMAVDGLGNIIVANATPVTLTKLSSQLSQIWQVKESTVKFFTVANIYPGFAADATGNIFVAGTGGANANGEVMAAVQQVLPDGTMGWMEQIGPSNAAAFLTAATVGADGTLYAVGGSQGQLPNQPPAPMGAGFLLHYSAAGTLLQAVQSTSIGQADDMLVVDSTGNSVVGEQLSKLDSNFNVLWAGNAIAQTETTSPDGNTVYDQESLGISEVLNLVTRNPATGAIVSERTFAKQTATLNAVEQEVWNGAFMDSQPLMVASSNALYMVGSYSNTYMNGSSPPPATQTVYVLCLDTMGNQIWFRQFLYAITATTPASSFLPNTIALNGTKLVIASPSFLFQLNTADGTGP